MKPFRSALLGGLVLLALASGGCKRYIHDLQARDQLNKGVGAYRSAQFQPAIMHFKQAVALDPSLLNARLYLAEAYNQQYVPGGDSPENVKIGKQAIEAFEDVLKMDPKNDMALASVGQTYYNMKDFTKAKEYQRKRIEADPRNPEPYYWIGVINWAIAYPKRMAVRKDLGLAAPKDPGHPDQLPPLPEKARAKLAEDNGALVEEGINALKKDVELKPNDSDAMAYLNLLYREKSDLESDPSVRQADLQTANEYVQKAMNARKTQTTASSAHS
jgi:tetratricopeptide (TPR) repeat protein